MKKYISLFSFIAMFFLGMQFSSAQASRTTQTTPEAIAKQKTYEIHELVVLTGEQQSGVFRALVDAEENIKALNEKSDIEAIQKYKAEILSRLNDKIKGILTPDQYKTYLTSLEEKNKK
ncbi:hypothetical protein [Corallibacter sp.]|uniref:hypothetical protein n=1 Tax=Corallibacter sp. TaxID=2038084 RepID=UPI003AB39917